MVLGPLRKRFEQLLSQIIVFDPKERATAKQLLQNPIFDKIRKAENECDAPYKVTFELDDPDVFDYEKLRCNKFTHDYYVKLLVKEINMLKGK